MDMLFQSTSYNGWNYLSMLRLKLNHISKRDPTMDFRPVICLIIQLQNSIGLQMVYFQHQGIFTTPYTKPFARLRFHSVTFSRWETTSRPHPDRYFMLDIKLRMLIGEPEPLRNFSTIYSADRASWIHHHWIYELTKIHFRCSSCVV